MEINELISRMGGKTTELENSHYGDVDLVKLFSRFVPERQYVENGKESNRSPWNAISELFRSVKTREDQNFSAGAKHFEKTLYNKWFDASVFLDADLDNFLRNLSDYRIIDKYSRKNENQRIIVSFLYIDTLLSQLLDRFSERSVPATGYEHCQLRFDPMSNALDSRSSAKITLFRREVENARIATEKEDKQFVEDKREILRLLASEQYGLIENLKENGLFVSFVVKDYESMRLLKTQGKLFELFLYNRFRNSDLFDDVQTSLQVFWNANADDWNRLLRKKLQADNEIGYENYRNKKEELERDFKSKIYTTGKKNELDIVMSRGTNLFFVSCKMTRDLERSYITQINEEARHFHATPILAVSKDLSSSQPNIMNYLEDAKTVGVSVIGFETFLNDDQLLRVIEKLQKGYLVLGKQYCEKDTSASEEDAVSVNHVIDTEMQMAFLGSDSHEYPLKAGSNYIGRNLRKCTTAINDNSLSAIHCCVNIEGENKYEIEDLGSINGTFVNGTKLPSMSMVSISEGDNIKLGNLSFIFSKVASGHSIGDSTASNISKNISPSSSVPAAKKSFSPHSVRVARYQDLISFGMTALDIAKRLVENDYKLYPNMVVDNEGTPEQWADYLSSYPDTFRYLVNENNEIIGNWSFLAVSEDIHLEKLAAGELAEETFSLDETEYVLFPGDYIGYLLNLSLNDGYTSPANLNLLLSEFVAQMLEFAEEGIFFKSWYVNVFRKDHEAMYRRLGFSYLLDNKTFGKLYYLECNSSKLSEAHLNSSRKTMFSTSARLMELYHEHYTM